jgi:heptosyltransferase II
VSPAAGVGGVERLLVRAPNWLGDVVLSLPAVRDLRRAFPQARLEVLARASVAGLYGAVGEVDAVRTSGGWRADVRSLRGAFDAAVLLPNSFGSALSPRLAGVPERWGYATDGRGLLLTRRVRVPRHVRGRSQVYYYRAMLAGLGLDVSAPPDAALACPPAWSEPAAALLGPGEWIGLAPGAAFGSAKRWPAPRFAAAADRVARRLGAGVAVLGTAAERPLGEKIAAVLGAPARVLCGQTTLPELVGLLSRLRLLVTNDSGPMHVAAALGVPVVAVFGPTDWRETSPVGEAHRLVRQEVYCSPCGLRECPVDHRCMKRVTVDQVAEAAADLLARA